jgi:hypothetical protein
MSDSMFWGRVGSDRYASKDFKFQLQLTLQFSKIHQLQDLTH